MFLWCHTWCLLCSIGLFWVGFVVFTELGWYVLFVRRAWSVVVGAVCFWSMEHLLFWGCGFGGFVVVCYVVYLACGVVVCVWLRGSCCFCLERWFGRVVWFFDGRGCLCIGILILVLLLGIVCGVWFVRGTWTVSWIYVGGTGSWGLWALLVGVCELDWFFCFGVCWVCVV